MEPVKGANPEEVIELAKLGFAVGSAGTVGYQEALAKIRNRVNDPSNPHQKQIPRSIPAGTPKRKRNVTFADNLEKSPTPGGNKRGRTSALRNPASASAASASASAASDSAESEEKTPFSTPRASSRPATRASGPQPGSITPPGEPSRLVGAASLRSALSYLTLSSVAVQISDDFIQANQGARGLPSKQQSFFKGQRRSELPAIRVMADFIQSNWDESILRNFKNSLGRHMQEGDAPFDGSDPQVQRDILIPIMLGVALAAMKSQKNVIPRGTTPSKKFLTFLRNYLEDKFQSYLDNRAQSQNDVDESADLLAGGEGGSVDGGGGGFSIALAGIVPPNFAGMPRSGGSDSRPPGMRGLPISSQDGIRGFVKRGSKFKSLIAKLKRIPGIAESSTEVKRAESLELAALSVVQGGNGSGDRKAAKEAGRRMLAARQASILRIDTMLAFDLNFQLSYIQTRADRRKDLLDPDPHATQIDPFSPNEREREAIDNLIRAAVLDAGSAIAALNRLAARGNVNPRAGAFSSQGRAYMENVIRSARGWNRSLPLALVFYELVMTVIEWIELLLASDFHPDPGNQRNLRMPSTENPSIGTDPTDDDDGCYSN